jgi:hypothetical protein
MTMEMLYKSIMSRPHEFDPAMFTHCGWATLVRVAQEVTPKPQDLERAVVHHHVLVSRLATA